MPTPLKTSCFVVLVFTLLNAYSTQAQEAKYPIVKDFGGIYEIPGAENPDPEMTYNIVIDLKTNQPDKGRLNPGLNNVARMMNLHGLGGVSTQNLHVTVAIHGGATEVILNNEAYRKNNGVDNPNLELIEALKESGAKLYVCGQSLLARGYKQEEVNQEVTIGLSMLTVVTEHMHKGYKLLVFD